MYKGEEEDNNNTKCNDNTMVCKDLGSARLDFKNDEKFAIVEEQVEIEAKNVVIERPVKKHGFIQPFHTLQVSAWVVFTLNIFIFYVLLIVSFSEIAPFAVVISIIFLIINITVAYYTIKCGNSDPTDPIVYQERTAKLQNKPFNAAEYSFFCNICNTHVGNRTKHCGECNRCVDIFDHHCKWLNNCVGSKNYKYFLKLLISVTVYCGFNVACFVVYFVYYAIASSLIKETHKHMWGMDLSLPCLIIFGFFCFVNTVFMMLIIQLISLHVWLHSKKMTTYEYIRYKRNKIAAKNEAKKIKKEEKKSGVIVKVERETKKLDDKSEQILTNDIEMHKLSNGKNNSNLGHLFESDVLNQSNHTNVHNNSPEKSSRNTILSNRHSQLQEEEERKKKAEARPNFFKSLFCRCFKPSKKQKDYKLKNPQIQPSKTINPHDTLEIIDEKDMKMEDIEEDEELKQKTALNEFINALSSAGCEVEVDTISEPGMISSSSHLFAISQSAEIPVIIAKGKKEGFIPDQVAFSFGLKKKTSSSNVDVRNHDNSINLHNKTLTKHEQDLLKNDTISECSEHGFGEGNSPYKNDKWAHKSMRNLNEEEKRKYSAVSPKDIEEEKQDAKIQINYFDNDPQNRFNSLTYKDTPTSNKTPTSINQEENKEDVVLEPLDTYQDHSLNHS